MKFFSAVCVVLLLLGAIAFAGMPPSNHVVLVVEENHSYSSVIGSSSMPYLNSLVAKYGLATKYYANTHPSIGNYFMLTTGQIVTNDDSYTGVINVDDVVKHLQTAGKTWKSYAESLPYAGYTGGNTGYYMKRHNPFSYFSEVVNSSEKYNLVPFTQFAKDLANNQLPNFSFIVPNVVDDAHDGTLSQADAWLSKNIAPLLINATFQKDGVLVIVFDESTTSDTQGGGGHVAAVVIGPKVKSGYKSTATYQHQSTLKSLLQALGLTSFPGAAENAPNMGEFFTTSTTTGKVTVTSPTNNSIVNSPVHFVATSKTSCSKGMSAIGIYRAPGQLAYWVGGANLDHYLSLAPGTYNTTVQAWDNCSNAFKSFITITVQ